MTADQIIKALNRYAAIFELRPGVRPFRFPVDGRNPSQAESLGHLYWMVIEAKNNAVANPDKAVRWLCFIQGALWQMGGHSIDEFRADNLSEV
jgi:hypothetical protein